MILHQFHFRLPQSKYGPVSPCGNTDGIIISFRRRRYRVRNVPPHTLNARSQPPERSWIARFESFVTRILPARQCCPLYRGKTGTSPVRPRPRTIIEEADKSGRMVGARKRPWLVDYRIRERGGAFNRPKEWDGMEWKRRF